MWLHGLHCLRAVDTERIVGRPHSLIEDRSP